jgi:NTE family protein
VGDLAMVLAGGAARGAYEAGVLRFVYTELTQRLGRAPWPSVVSGTSVGALNGSFVVARDMDGLAWMSRKWREIEVPEVFGISMGDLVRTLRHALGGKPFAIADPRPLHRMVARQFPLKGVRRAVREHGVTWLVGATDLVSGEQVVFVDRAEPPQWHARPGVRYVPVAMRSIHALASGALPLLFPPISINGRLYVDGGLRQNTPLGPVLRAGARRVLVVSLKRQAQDVVRPPQPPNLVFLVGKLLNALLLDPVEVDLYEAEQVNALIRWGSERFGPEFTHGIEQDLGLREAEILFLTPSEDLGAIAAETYRRAPPRVAGVSAQLLERAAAQSGPDADLLSYIYFDRQYTSVLEALGFEDARRNEEAIARLVGPG